MNTRARGEAGDTNDAKRRERRYVRPSEVMWNAGRRAGGCRGCGARAGLGRRGRGWTGGGRAIVDQRHVISFVEAELLAFVIAWSETNAGEEDCCSKQYHFYSSVSAAS